MKRLKKIVLGLILTLLPTFTFAAFDDAALQSGAVITANSVSIDVSGTSGVVENIVVNEGDFTLQMQSSSRLKITVPNFNQLSYTTSVAGADLFDYTCNASNSTLEITHITSAQSTITITPSATLCGATTASSGSGGVISGGGGGGGGGSSYVYTPPVTTNSASSTVSAPSTLPMPVSVSAIFSTNIIFGMTSPDVKRLQQLLAQDASIYPGGLASGYFGPATKAAVQRFQVKYAIAKAGESGYGSVGPKTRAKLLEVFGGSFVVPQVSTSALPQSGVSAVFATTLKMGMTHPDVKRLQQLLSQDKEIYPEANTSGYFGGLTLKAVQRFQAKYGIASEGTPSTTGYGLVGAKTRAKLLEVFGK